jgi:Zn-dependent peptidase ImmA (M78 family)
MGKKIRRIINELFKDLKITKAPIDIEKICSMLNVKVIYDNKLEDDISGFLYKKPNRNVIVVNDEHSQNRKRFTMAHELGHLLLNHGGDVFVDREGRFIFRDSKSQSGLDIQERDANKFAAELLMPVEMVIKELNKIDNEMIEDRDIDKLAMKFDVSSQAMTIRLVNLNLIQM